MQQAQNYGQPPAMNPYAAPTHGQMGATAAPGAPGQDFWRQGDVLVCRKGAHLPDLCLATGTPTGGNMVLKKLQWYPPWIGALVIISWPIALILMFVMRKKGDLTYYLSSEAQAKRKKALMIGGGVLALSVLLFIVGASAEAIPLFLLAFVGFLAGIIVMAAVGVPYRVQKIDNEFIHLKLKPAYWGSSGM